MMGNLLSKAFLGLVLFCKQDMYKLPTDLHHMFDELCGHKGLMFCKPGIVLGQHFLNDLILAKNIVDSIPKESGKRVLELGPGQGVLTPYLLEKDFEFKLVTP